MLQGNKQNIKNQEILYSLAEEMIVIACLQQAWRNDSVEARPKVLDAADFRDLKHGDMTY
jgi:hypothetical protein